MESSKQNGRFSVSKHHMGFPSFPEDPRCCSLHRFLENGRDESSRVARPVGPGPWWFSVNEGIVLPSYIGIIISQYKDPYEPISANQCNGMFWTWLKWKKNSLPSLMVVRRSFSFGRPIFRGFGCQFQGCVSRPVGCESWWERWPFSKPKWRGKGRNWLGGWALASYLSTGKHIYTKKTSWRYFGEYVFIFSAKKNNGTLDSIL